MSTAPAWLRQPIAAGLGADGLTAAFARFAVQRDPADRWNLTLLLAREHLREAAACARDDERLAFDQLLDVAAVDYLAYPGHRGPRFAVIYLFKSSRFRHRLALKVPVDEGDASIPSLHDLFPIADWMEREAWDQLGIAFTGHPNLKRLLNHHEFVGHPLRKDYPCQQRQKLSLNDPMGDQLEARLRQRGYEVLDRPATGAKP